MAHVGRTVKNVEAPRPLKTQLRVPIKSNLMLIEELIQLIENVALALQSGDRSTEPTSALVENLRVHGPQLESVSKDTLDRAFVAFRNASQDERLNIMTRLHLLELIELRAKGWEDSGFNSYYKTKHVEIPEVLQHPDPGQASFLSTSPTYVGNIGLTEVVAGGSSPQQLLLGPGELIRNSGKFAKPTKIPGKTYCKDEVVIRNADSGKVMGIKGRRVHMIEELSETIISFQRVNPGAKERLVQITGPTEEKINYAKQLIGDTIRRNASPVRLDATGAATGGSCSSLASSNSDEATPRAAPAVAGNNHTANRLSLNANNNRFVNSAVGSATHAALQQAALSALINSSLSKIDVKTMTNNPQLLLHSYSASDATLGEYKYTVNVGQHVIKITGNCCDLVKVAKLVLDDYFSSAEFLASVEAGAAIDGSLTPPLVDSGINLNIMSGGKAAAGGATDGDDDVFADANGAAAPASNGVVRSRRSHFSRLDSTPDAASDAAHSKGANENGKSELSFRITYEHQHLLYFAKSPHSWVFPLEWQEICEKAPAIVRNKDLTDESNRFNGDKYLTLPKSCESGHLATSEESLNEADNQEIE